MNASHGCARYEDRRATAIAEDQRADRTWKPVWAIIFDSDSLVVLLAEGLLSTAASYGVREMAVTTVKSLLSFSTLESLNRVPAFAFQTATTYRGRLSVELESKQKSNLFVRREVPCREQVFDTDFLVSAKVDQDGQLPEVYSRAFLYKW